jgi:lactate permease
MTWTQNYDPLGNPLLSTLLAALPIVLLLGALATGRVPSWLAALLGLAAAYLTAALVFVADNPGLPDRGARVAAWAPTMLAALGHGAAFGLLPIGWIVLAAIFLYTLTVETGQFEIVKHSIATLSDDRRLQALLIAFSFGAFVEGAAGFGTPVAISAALMMGAGFKPLQAAGLALLANTSPVAFGALGSPIIMLAKVTVPPDPTVPPDVALAAWELRLSQMAGRQLPIFSLLVPVWLVWVMAGWRGVRGVWPALLVCGGSFALVQFLASNLHGPWLVDVAGGLVSMVCLALFLRVWKPREIWHFADEPPPAAEARRYTTRQVVAAWVPWLLLTAFVFLWGLPQIKQPLSKTSLTVAVPSLHETIQRGPAVAEKTEPEIGTYDFHWLSTTGTGIFLAAVASAAWLRIGPRRFVALFGLTCWRMRWPIFTIACMLAIASVTRFSGMDAALGLALTQTGWIYPLFAALLGWLGVALTGSDTSSNALFGSLQTITARKLVHNGVLPLTEPQAMVLLATANSTGGVMGKMIDAQSIVVAAAATQQPGHEGPILRFVFLHSLVLAILMGLLVLLQAYVWTAVIP